MKDVTIRACEPGDRAACRDLYAELTQRHRDIYDDPSIGGDDPGAGLDDLLARGDLAGLWVAERGGEVLGFAGLLVTGPQGEVEPVVVSASERSRGIGTRLLVRLADEARARGVRYLSIRPVARNAEAVACFHRAGFRTLGHLDMFMDLRSGEPSPWKRGIVIHGREFEY